MENVKIRLKDEERAREFIKKFAWKFAKTMPWVPHYYLHIDKVPAEMHDEFKWFVSTIKTHGKMLAWGRKSPKPYWFIDEWKYWIMEEDSSTTTLVNRAEHHI